MAKSEHYQGHEQTRIKHLVLEKYLKTLFMIVGQKKSRICYVDCFAGPWREADEKLSGTSIKLALDIMKDCHRSLLYGHNQHVEFRALFLERRRRSFQKLKAYLESSEWQGVTTTSIHGKFHEQINQILEWCGPRDFVFFFVDHTGWKNAIEVPTLLPLLNRPHSEYLINFMYGFLNRAQPQAIFRTDMEAIFGEAPIAELDRKQREPALLNRYLEALRGTQRSSTRLRSAYVTVLDPIIDRTKYHLVYLTRHELGIRKFMQVSQNLRLVQPKVRAQAKQSRRIEQTGQQELFHAGEGGMIHMDAVELDTVESYWLATLTTKPKIFGIAELADMLEETGWFETDLQRAFKELEKEDKVENLSAPKPNKRRTKPIHFEKREKLRRK